MKTRIVATLLSGLITSSCVVKVQVKKENKASQLKSTPADSSVSIAGQEDFLKHLDGLRTTAADLLIKELAQRDYVGTFRSSIRKYRDFIIAKSGKRIILADSFYSDSANYCRKTGVDLNGDNSSETLGILLKTVVLAKLSETDLGKINSSLAKEAQSVAQLITKELGLEIVGTSTMTDENGLRVTKGSVTIHLTPIAGEAIDEAMKHRDSVEILSLDFERTLGANSVGSFASTVALPYEKGTDTLDATGSITVSRVKDGLDHVHELQILFGTTGADPSYSRALIVREDHSQSSKFEVTEIFNVGSSKESSHKSFIDLKAGTQCKGSGTPPAGDPVVYTTPSESTVEAPLVVKSVETESGSIAPVRKPGTGPNQSPAQTPAQTPAQAPAQVVVK